MHERHEARPGGVAAHCGSDSGSGRLAYASSTRGCRQGGAGQRRTDGAGQQQLRARSCYGVNLAAHNAFVRRLCCCCRPGNDAIPVYVPLNSRPGPHPPFVPASSFVPCCPPLAASVYLASQCICYSLFPASACSASARSVSPRQPLARAPRSRGPHKLPRLCLGAARPHPRVLRRGWAWLAPSGRVGCEINLHRDLHSSYFLAPGAGCSLPSAPVRGR